MPTINRKQLGSTRTKRSQRDSYKEYSKYYSSPLWRELRNQYLEKHPLCECCLEHDRIVPAEVVHHMIPFSRGVDEKHKMKLLLEPKNLKSLCKTCHKLLHKKDYISRQEVLDKLTDKEYEDGWQLKFMK